MWESDNIMQWIPTEKFNSRLHLSLEPVSLFSCLTKSRPRRSLALTSWQELLQEADSTKSPQWPIFSRPTQQTLTRTLFPEQDFSSHRTRLDTTTKRVDEAKCIQHVYYSVGFNIQQSELVARAAQSRTQRRGAPARFSPARSALAQHWTTLKLCLLPSVT